MNLLQIEYFRTVAKLGSFRKAAETHFISQPAVSKQISLLEKEWGVTLFDRSYRTATLTTSGQIMLEALEKAEGVFSNALYQAQLRSRKISYELHLGLPESSNFTKLSAILADFQQQHPDILLKISFAPLSALSLQDGKCRFDMVINYEYNLLNQSGLETRKLSQHQHIALVSRDYAQRMGHKLAFEDLKHECLLIPAAAGTTVTKDYAAYICELHGFSPGQVETLPNIESVCMAIKIGRGYAILDDLVSIPARYELVEVPTNVYFPIYLAWQAENKNPAITLLADAITQGFAEK